MNLPIAIIMPHFYAVLAIEFILQWNDNTLSEYWYQLCLSLTLANNRDRSTISGKIACASTCNAEIKLEKPGVGKQI